MLSRVCSAAVNGIEAYPVEVEVNVGYGDTLVVIVVNNTPKQFLGRLIGFLSILLSFAIPVSFQLQASGKIKEAGGIAETFVSFPNTNNSVKSCCPI